MCFRLSLILTETVPSTKPLIFLLTQLYVFIYEQVRVSVLAGHHHAVNTMC